MFSGKEQAFCWGGVAWNPDSARLLIPSEFMTSGHPGGRLAVALINDSQALQVVGVEPTLQAVWSPDGKKVAYIQLLTLASALGPGDRARWVSMSVVEIDGIEPRSSRPVFFPEGMIPVSIDW